MVQRKVSNKLALQPHHLKNESLLHQQDVKTKKMKKSGSIKRPEFNGPRSPRATRQPRKRTTMAKTPNYMKSTTSSDARKEQSHPQVSAKTINPDRKSSTSRTSKTTSSASCNKAKKTLARMNTSLKSLTKNPSFKPARTSSLVRKCSPVVLCEDLDAQRATCSSTLKDCKFPAYLSLEPEGTSTVKVCPYTYCSLNGHRHPSLPPLKSFLSAKRHVIKAQRSLRVGCLSPRRAKPVGDDSKSSRNSPADEGEERADFFIEIYVKEKEDQEQVVETLLDAPIFEEWKEEVEPLSGFASELPVENSKPNDQSYGVDSEASSDSKPNDQSYEPDSEGSDMEWETADHMALHLDYAGECSPETEIEPDPEADKDKSPMNNEKFIIESDNEDGCFDEFLAEEISQESFSEESSNSDGESIGSYDYLQVPVEVPAEESKVLFSDEGHEAQSEISYEDQTNETENQGNPVENLETLSPVDPEKECHSNEAKGDAANQETEEDSALAIVKGKRKRPEKEMDELGAFNPREPNFLPVEPEPEAEKVNLRHQDLDEKKNSEEWMMDYALRQTVTKLGPARKRKVALLVEAFEKVMPTTKCELHLRHPSMFDQARPMQACS